MAQRADHQEYSGPLYSQRSMALYPTDTSGVDVMHMHYSTPTVKRLSLSLPTKVSTMGTLFCLAALSGRLLDDAVISGLEAGQTHPQTDRVAPQMQPSRIDLHLVT